MADERDQILQEIRTCVQLIEQQTAGIEKRLDKIEARLEAGTDEFKQLGLVTQQNRLTLETHRTEIDELKDWKKNFWSKVLAVATAVSAGVGWLVAYMTGGK